MQGIQSCSKCGNGQAVPYRAVSMSCSKCQQVHNYSVAPHHIPAPPNTYGPKRALICGISYSKTCRELKGSLNDAKCVRYLLLTKFNFPDSAILMLTDQDNPSNQPTKDNIRRAMAWLVQDCREGDSLVFHYSGHGSHRRKKKKQRDTNGDEIDGYYETLLPLDYKKNGVIVDDEINAVLVRNLPTGVRLHAIIDACHSGTVMDLPYKWKTSSQGGYWEDHTYHSRVWKGTSGGEAYCFSGCDDNQTSADTTVLSQVAYTGAMTYSFIRAIEKGNAKTYQSLLNAMREGVRAVETGCGSSGPLTGLVRMLLTGGNCNWNHTQEPQLTSSLPFAINMPFGL